MMKKLYLIGGTMGVGKTAVGQTLKRKLPDSVFLDGDWCWDMHPFRVTEHAKIMVMDNICYLLKNFLRSPDYKSVIFSWVMHEQGIIDEIVERTAAWDVEVVKLSLVCREDVLRARLQRDIDAGIREPDILERSLVRLPFYRHLDTIKIDVSDMTVGEAAEFISRM